MSLTPHHRPSPRPTLEDLLQLKRNERPRPEFWDEFNRGLREKQLAALVKQPRGWARLRPIFVRSFRWSVPATVAAVATFGFVRHLVIAPGVLAEQAPAPASAQARPVVAVVDQSRTSAPETPAAETFRPAEAPVAYERQFPVTVVASTDSAVPLRDLAPAVSTTDSRPHEPRVSLASAVVSAATEVLHQPAEYVQSRFDSVASFGQQVAQLTARPESGPVGSWGDFDSRLMQVTALDLRVTGEHAANLMTTPVSYSPQPREKVRLPDDEREYRDVSRFGVQGSSLSIRF